MHSSTSTAIDSSLLGILRGHSAGITSLSHHPSQDLFASGDQNGVIHIWRNALATRRSQSRLEMVANGNDDDNEGNRVSATALKLAHKNKHFMVLQLCWAAPLNDDQWLLSQSRCCLLRKIDVNRNQTVGAVRYGEELIQTSFCKMKFNPVSNLIALPSTGSIELYSGKDLSRVQVLKWENSESLVPIDDEMGHTKLGMLMAMEFHETREYSLFAAFENGQILEWDVRLSHGQPVSCIRETLMHEPIMSIKNFSVRRDPNLDTIGIATTGNKLYFQSVGHKDSTSEHQLQTEGINDMIIVNKGRLLCTGGWDHRVRIFELKKNSKQVVPTLKPLAIFKNHTAAVTCLDTNHEQNILISGSQDERLCVWSLSFNKKK